MRRIPWGKIFGWAALSLFLVLVGWLGYRVWYYVDLIRSGAIVDMPQYSSKITSTGGPLKLSSNLVDRVAVESPTSPALGSLQPQLTIVEFADFRCPYSREVSTVTRTLMAKYGDRARLIFRNFPVTELHPDAYQAALASECAEEQGKFWLYHDRLFAAPTLNFQKLVQMAEETGMDRQQFDTCLSSSKYKARVDADVALAKSLGLRGTPTFIFDGQVVEGSIPRDVFERIITRLLK